MCIRDRLKANHCEMRDLRFKKVTDGTIFDDGYLKVTAIPTCLLYTSAF